MDLLSLPLGDYGGVVRNLGEVRKLWEGGGNGSGEGVEEGSPGY